MAKKKDYYQLVVPIDASGIEDFKPEQDVKIVAKDRSGTVHSQTVKLSRKGHGEAAFQFGENPGSVHIVMGPADATDEEMFGLQTLNFRVSSRHWRDNAELTLQSTLIPAYYWYFWLRWCRIFTIRGRVVCPDGRAVPGAEVCAFDIDPWFMHTSRQQVGCATTDINGAFEIRFRWCCGWWPWWWWRYRVWQLEPVLVERVGNVLRQNPNLQLDRVGNRPSLALFNQIVEASAPVPQTLRAADVSLLPQLRNRLVAELPTAVELERLHIWPWYPWQPWWDCTPDIIFRVTQDCDQAGAVLLDEDYGDVRWNIPTTLNVTLVAAENACCVPPPPDEGGECIIMDQVCHYDMDMIGGNLGAAPAPVGYANPGAVPMNSWGYHRPFAGIIPIWKNPAELLNVDYLEIEILDGATWKPLEDVVPGAVQGFERRYWWAAATPAHAVTAPFPFTPIDGHLVVQTREHYEANSGMTWDMPGADAFWLSTNWNLLVPLDTQKFDDGTYRFRVVGWDESGGSLSNPRVLPVCGSQTANELVLTFDNRLNPDPAHPASHPCGGSSIHACTTEPDTHILDVRINGVSVSPCDTVDAASGWLEVDFMAHDPDGHLGGYWIRSTWGLSDQRQLLNRAGVSVTPMGTAVPDQAKTGWVVTQVQGNYGTAVNGGATPPVWEGGYFTLRMPVSEAFPEPCCYQLELYAWKRTIIGHKAGRTFTCHGTYHNQTHYSIGVGVCGDEDPPVLAAADRLVAGNR